MQALTLDAAESAMVDHLHAAGWKARIEYDRSRVIESKDWWYIPYGWIGCFGFFVDKEDAYVDWLGSGMFTIEDCIWAHDRGIVNEIVDFTVHEVENVSVLFDLFRYFRRLRCSRNHYHFSNCFINVWR